MMQSGTRSSTRLGKGAVSLDGDSGEKLELLGFPIQGIGREGRGAQNVNLDVNWRLGPSEYQF
jgi:hypothetical protein